MDCKSSRLEGLALKALRTVILTKGRRRLRTLRHVRLNPRTHKLVLQYVFMKYISIVYMPLHKICIYSEEERERERETDRQTDRQTERERESEST